MAVSFVAGSTTVTASGASITDNAPAGIADDDILFAAVFARSDLNTPTGWTKLVETAQFDTVDDVWNQRLAVFQKDTVTSSDASASFTFTSAAGGYLGGRMALTYQVWRDVDSIPETQTTTLTDVSTFLITPTTVTADIDGTGIAVFGSTIVAATADPVTPTGPTGFTVTSGTGVTGGLRLGGFYDIVNDTEGNSGSVDMQPTYSMGGASNGLGAITVRLAPAGLPSISSYVEVDSPIGAPAAEIEVQIGVMAAADSPLGAPSQTIATDFHSLIAGSPVYSFMDVTLSDDSVVRIPVSSWQATLQTDGQCYLRCSIPAPTEWIDALGDTVSFSITIQTTTRNDETIERVIASVADPLLQTDQGATNYTAQLSGYFAALPARPDPDTAFYRPLLGVSTTSVQPTSMRVRCSIDWIMQPSDYATDGAITFQVAYMNLYATGNQMYMDAGSRPPALA